MINRMMKYIDQSLLTKYRVYILKAMFLMIILIIAFIVLNHLTLNDFTNFIHMFVTEKNPISIYLIFFTISVLACFIFIPVSWIKLSGGLLLGFWPGFLLSWSAVNIGSFLLFITCRTFGRDYFKKVLKTKIKDDSFLNNLFLDIENKGKGLPLVMNLRMIPIFPAAVVNILCGLSTISTKNYILGSLIGTLPGTIIAVNIAAAITTSSSNPFYLLLLVVIFVLFNLAIHLYNKKSNLLSQTNL